MKLDHDGYPTTCAVCGKPVVKSRGGSVHQLTTATGHAQSWHLECRYPKERPTMSDTTTEPETAEPEVPTPLEPEPPAEPPDPEPDDDDQDEDEAEQ